MTSLTAMYRTRRRRLRVRLTISGLAAALAFWKLHGHGDLLWTVAAMLGGLAVLGTLTQLGRLTDEYEAAQILAAPDAVDQPRSHGEAPASTQLNEGADQ